MINSVNFDFFSQKFKMKNGVPSSKIQAPVWKESKKKTTLKYTIKINVLISRLNYFFDAKQYIYIYIHTYVFSSKEFQIQEL